MDLAISPILTKTEKSVRGGKLQRSDFFFYVCIKNICSFTAYKTTGNYK